LIFAIVERTWHIYAFFGACLLAFSVYGWHSIGEWNGFLSAILIAGLFAILVAKIVHVIDAREKLEEKI